MPLFAGTRRRYYCRLKIDAEEPHHAGAASLSWALVTTLVMESGQDVVDAQRLEMSLPRLALATPLSRTAPHRGAAKDS